MAEDRYVIIQRSGEWLVLLDGNRTGPFETREEAAHSAVAQAQTRERTGQRAEVHWEDSDGDPVFYSSPQED